MRRALLAAAAALPILGGAALAETYPVAGKFDSRIRTVAYNPMQVVSIKTTGFVPVEIVYEPGEVIKAASGPMVDLKPVCEDADDKPCPKEVKNWEPTNHTWVVIASANTLTLDPEMAPPDTVLWVRTDRAGEQRLYRYQLGTRAAGSMTDKADKAAYMTVMYTYPHRTTPEEIAAAQARRQAAAERFTQMRMAEARAAAPKNREYEKRGDGCAYIAPRSTTDDGVRTQMLFAPQTQIPAILHVIPNGTPDGEEATLTPIPETTPDGLLVTLPAVYPELRLRYGNTLVCGLRPKRDSAVTQTAATRTAHQ